jgi:hypothetical protein
MQVHLLEPPQPPAADVPEHGGERQDGQDRWHGRILPRMFPLVHQPR